MWPKVAKRPRADAWEVTPALCVEVISPTDKLEEVDDKVFEYLSSGVKLVWVVRPRSERIDVYTSSDSVRILNRKDVLTGGDVLPGFELPLAELFPMVEAVAAG